MKSPVRTVAVLAAAAVLVALFLYNVDIWRVGREIVRANPWWLGLAALTMVLNLTIRAIRWQYLLSPLGHIGFGRAFRATAVGYAATTIFPARAGEVIRPYFLARCEKTDAGVTATGAFATVILERLLDVVTVLGLLASFVFVYGRGLTAANPLVFAAVKWGALMALAVTLIVLVVLFIVAGNPLRISRAMTRLEQVIPSALAGLIARLVGKFAAGLAAIRRPGRLLGALVWSVPLWLSIALGIWAVSMAFRLAIPFTGSFLLLSILVLGVTVPTPGAIGGFHEAFRIGATAFYGVPDARAVGAAIVLHVISIGPSLLLGLYFAAHAGLNLSRMRDLADKNQQEDASGLQVPPSLEDAGGWNRNPRRAGQRSGGAA